MEDRQAREIDELATEAEAALEPQLAKKDQKEQRAMVKNKLYNGSNKLKHRIPKGKQV